MPVDDAPAERRRATRNATSRVGNDGGFCTNTVSGLLRTNSVHVSWTVSRKTHMTECNEKSNPSPAPDSRQFSEDTIDEVSGLGPRCEPYRSAPCRRLLRCRRGPGSWLIVYYRCTTGCTIVLIAEGRHPLPIIGCRSELTQQRQRPSQRLLSGFRLSPRRRIRPVKWSPLRCQGHLRCGRPRNGRRQSGLEGNPR